MRIAIVGGGMAGLCALRELKARVPNAEVRLFEAGTRVGGQVTTRWADGFLLEEGPNSLRGGAMLIAALESSGAGGEVLLAPAKAPRFVWRAGKLRRAPGPSFVSPLGMARALLEPIFARRPVNGEEPTLDALFERRFGGEAGRVGARLAANGIFAGDPSALSAPAALPRLWAALGTQRTMLGAMRLQARALRESGAPTSLWSLRTGLSGLPARLASAHIADISLGARVESIGSQQGGWAVSGHGRFDAVVMALPAHAASVVLREASPSIARQLDEVIYAPVAVVHLGYVDAAMPNRLEGFGFLDGDNTLRLLGTIFSSSLFPNRAPEGHTLLTSLVGGASAAQLVELGDGPLIDLVRADFTRALGITTAPEFARVVRHPKGIPQPVVGHLSRIASIREFSKRLPPLAFAGAAFGGVSVPDVAQSGIDAAHEVLKRLN